jgi:ceramide glucosyltransferase
MGTLLTELLLAVVALSLGATLASHVAVRRLLARPCPAARHAPPVTVLKPLKGMDDGLYENLLSFVHQDYPAFEIVCGTPDADDPAIEVVARLAAEHPGIPISVTVCQQPIGLNPKVNTLGVILPAARHDHVLVSDSNVRVGPTYLRETVAEMADPRVGLVTNLLAGVEERSIGSAFENAHLGSFVAGSVAAAYVLAGRAIVVGKSMLFRRSDLDALGGLGLVADILAEDYVLGRGFAEAGRRVVVSSHVVRTVVQTWSVGRFLARHVRWGQLRRRISPGAYLAEPLLNPVAWCALLLAAAAAGAAVGSLDGAALATLALGGVLVKVASDALLLRRLRGRPLAAAHVALVPVKDLLAAGVWVVAAFRRSVEWRGTPLRIGPGSRLSRGPARRVEGKRAAGLEVSG